MITRTLKLFAAFALTFIVVGSALADGIPLLDRNGKPFRVQRMTGSHVTFTGTNDALDFEFESDYVTLCMDPQSEPVFIRFGTGTDYIEGNPVAYVTDANTFETGSDGTAYGIIAGRAFVMSASPDTINNIIDLSSENVVQKCQSHPWSARGLVFAVDTAGTATLDVNAFSSR